MLDAARQHLGALAPDRLAVHVPAAGHHVQVPPAVPAQPGDRQAALGPDLLLVADHVEGRVDQVPGEAVAVVGEHPQADAELRRGEPGPALARASCRSGRRPACAARRRRWSPPARGCAAPDRRRAGRAGRTRISSRGPGGAAAARGTSHRLGRRFCHAAAAARGPRTCTRSRRRTRTSAHLGRVQPDPHRVRRLAGGPGGLRGAQRGGQRPPSARGTRSSARSRISGSAPCDPSPPAGRGPHRPAAPARPGRAPRVTTEPRSRRRPAAEHLGDRRGAALHGGHPHRGREPDLGARPASSAAACQAGSQRTRACTGGQRGSATTTTRPPSVCGTTSAAAPSQRRSVSSATRRSGRASSAQPSSSSAAP